MNNVVSGMSLHCLFTYPVYTQTDFAMFHCTHVAVSMTLYLRLHEHKYYGNLALNPLKCSELYLQTYMAKYYTLHVVYLAAILIQQFGNCALLPKSI